MRLRPRIPVLDRAPARRRRVPKRDMIERAACLCSGLSYARYGSCGDDLDYSEFDDLAAEFDMGGALVVHLADRAFDGALHATYDRNVGIKPTWELWAIAASMLMCGEVEP